MLADEILGLPEIVMPADLKVMVRRAHRFAIDDRLVTLAHHAKYQRPSKTIGMLPYAKIPFEISWFEWARSAPIHPYDADPANQRTGKSGALVCCDDTQQRGWIAFFCSWPGGARSLEWPIVMRFDWTADFRGKIDSALFEEAPHTTPESAIRSAANMEHPWAPFITEPGEACAAAELDNRTMSDALPSTEAKRLLIMAMDRAKDRDDWDARVMDMTVYLGMHSHFVLALCLLLNCKNLVTATDLMIEPSLQRSRIKKGKLPLLSFRSLAISINHPLRARAATASQSGDPARAHFVRGHFKTRRTGIFWWAPFVRGDAKRGVVLKDYRVME